MRHKCKFHSLPVAGTEDKTEAMEPRQLQLAPCVVCEELMELGT